MYVRDWKMEDSSCPFLTYYVSVDYGSGTF